MKKYATLIAIICLGVITATLLIVIQLDRLKKIAYFSQKDAEQLQQLERLEKRVEVLEHARR